MSRSGYTEEDDSGTLGLWRGAVKKSISGKRGQAALQELAEALDAMPEKKLAAESLVTEDGEFCTLGVLGKSRGLNMGPLDPDDWDAVAKAFNIAPAMVREIVYENDESIEAYEWIVVDICGPVRRHYPDYGSHTRSVRIDIPAEKLGILRWKHMRKWVESNLKYLSEEI